LEIKFGKTVIANSVHPGGVATELVRGPIEFSSVLKFMQPFIGAVMNTTLLTPAQGALSTLYAATSPEIEKQNYRACYFVPHGVISTDINPLSLSNALAEKLWTYTEDLCKAKLSGK
jgi:hypothetical protein